MHLTGLALAEVLGLLGAAAAVVVSLYLLRVRRREIRIPYLALFDRLLAEKQTTRLFARVKRWLSLLLALLFVTLLAFALGDPRPSAALVQHRTLVVLIDASASMRATDVAPSRLESARERVEELIDDLGPSDRMLIAQMDRATRPLGTMSGDPIELRAALARLAATDLEGDLRRGLSLALDALRGHPDPEIVVVSDGNLRDAPGLNERIAREGVRLSSIAVGRADDNVAIGALAVRRYPLDKSQTEVLIELDNPTAVDRKVELTLLDDGAALDVRTLEIAAGKRIRNVFRNLSGADRTLEARIEPRDGLPDFLPTDDRAYARLPERRRARVLLVTDGNLYLEAALLLDEYLDVERVAPSSYSSDEGFDVVVFDDVLPATPPSVASIYLHPKPVEGAKGPLRVRGTVARPYFDRIDRDHPLVRFTSLDDVNVAEALAVELEEGDRIVAGDARAPLIVEGRRSERPFVAFTFDVRKSDLPMRVAWPLLLLHAIDRFVEDQAGFLSSQPTGRPVELRVPPEVDAIEIVGPDGERTKVPARNGRALVTWTHAGFHRLLADGFEETIAVNPSAPEESRIAPRARLEVAGSEVGPVSKGTVGVRRDLWVYLVFAALALLTLEWFTYHRRWTV